MQKRKGWPPTVEEKHFQKDLEHPLLSARIVSFKTNSGFQLRYAIMAFGPSAFRHVLQGNAPIKWSCLLVAIPDWVYQVEFVKSTSSYYAEWRGAGDISALQLFILWLHFANSICRMKKWRLTNTQIYLKLKKPSQVFRANTPHLSFFSSLPVRSEPSTRVPSHHPRENEAFGFQKPTVSKCSG